MSNTLQAPVTKTIPRNFIEDAEEQSFHEDSRVLFEQNSALAKHYHEARFIDYKSFIRNHPKAVMYASFAMGFIHCINESEIGF